MQFDYSAEQQQFADALRRWTERAYPIEHRRAVTASPAGCDPADWAALTELGLPALGVPEALGGLAGSGIDHLIALQEAGRALLAEPLFATLWGCAFLRRAGGHDPLLAKVASGSARLACAINEAGGQHAPEQVSCRALPDGSGWRLDGTKQAVLHGAQATALIVSARTSGSAADTTGISLFVVPAGTAGLTCHDCRAIDGTRIAQVALHDVRLPATALLGTVDAGWTILVAACDDGAALLCAEALGVMEAMRDDTLAHLRTREQFGIPIGQFQALQHRMADVFIHLEQARSLAWLAAAQVDQPDGATRRRAVSAAKARVNEALRFVAQQAVQLHGGLGMSEEVRVTQLFKRATLLELLLGDTDHHLHRFRTQS